MAYKRDPKKRLAQLLNLALNKRHTHAIIITDRLQMTGTDVRWLSCWVAWHPGSELVEIKQHLSTLPRVTC